MTEYIEAKLAAGGEPAGPVGMGPHDRDFGDGGGSGQRGGADAARRSAKRSTGSASRRRRSRKLYEKLSGLGLAARRKVTGIGPRRAEIIVPGLAVLLEFLREFQPAGDVLLARRSARRDHRGPGGAQRGRGAFAAQPGAARGGGADVPALRRVAGARAQGREYLDDVVHGAATAASAARRAAESCWRRRRTCTTSAITSAASGITSIPGTWWRMPICPDSRSASGC